MHVDRWASTVASVTCCSSSCRLSDRAPRSCSSTAPASGTLAPTLALVSPLAVVVLVVVGDVVVVVVVVAEVGRLAMTFWLLSVLALSSNCWMS